LNRAVSVVTRTGFRQSLERVIKTQSYNKPFGIGSYGSHGVTTPLYKIVATAIVIVHP
jgi:hypothetical protein